MLKMKQTIDLYAFSIGLVFLLGSYFTPIKTSIPIGLLIGILAGSIVMHKDLRKLENTKFNISVNLISNILIYTIALGSSSYFLGMNPFIFSAIGLIGYRNALLIKLK